MSLRSPLKPCFGGDAGDLAEVLGNLLDNAFKYGHSQIMVSATHSQAFTELVIEDDGPGISEKACELAEIRGLRFDSKQEGQGLGLAMVSEVLNSYNASLILEASPSLGGARVIVRYKNLHEKP